MKTPILALAVTLMPLSALAQSDKPKDTQEAPSHKGAEVEEVDIPTAKGLEKEIEAQQKSLLDALDAYVTAARAAAQEGKTDESATDAAAARTLEIEGVKMESFYDKAVHLRVKPAKGRPAFLSGSSRAARAMLALTTMPGALRQKLALAQISGGDAALDTVGYKIGQAERGAPSLLPDYIVERLMKAAVAVSQAHAALNAALGPRAGAQPADARDAAKPEPARTGGGK